MKSNIVNWAIAIFALVAIMVITVRYGNRRYREGVCDTFKLEQNPNMACKCEVKLNDIEVTCGPKVKSYTPIF